MTEGPPMDFWARPLGQATTPQPHPTINSTISTNSNSIRRNSSSITSSKGESEIERGCCPSVRNPWLLQPLLLRAQQVFSAVELELQQSQQQQHHIAFAAVRDLQAFADLLSSLVCSGLNTQEGLPHFRPWDTRMAVTKGLHDAVALSTAAAATTPAATTTGCARVAVAEGADSTPLSSTQEGREQQQQQQRQKQQQQQMAIVAVSRGRKRRQAFLTQSTAEGHKSAAAVEAEAAAATGAQQQRSCRKYMTRGSVCDDDDVAAAPSPGATAATLSTPAAAAAAAATPKAKCPTPAAAILLPAQAAAAKATSAAAATTATKGNQAPPAIPPPPQAAPQSAAAAAAASPAAAVAASAAAAPAVADFVSAAESSLGLGALGAAGLSAETLEVLMDLGKSEREETLNILQALALPTLHPQEQQKYHQQQEQDGGDAKLPRDASRVVGGSRTQGPPHCSLSLDNPPLDPPEGSDAEEGEISDYGSEGPLTLRDSSRQESVPAMQQARDLPLPLPPRNSAYGSSNSVSVSPNSEDLMSALGVGAPPIPQSGGPPDPSVLDALINARPLSNEGVLANLYSLRKSEARRPQQQEQKKPKRRTQEAQERHRQRWAEIQQRRAHAAAKRQQMSRGTHANELRGPLLAGGGAGPQVPPRPPPPPITPCAPC